MLQYLVILLDDTAVSYCHYENNKTERNLMPLETLKKGILFGMKENLNIQFVYPDYELPQEYQEIVETIDYTKIVPSQSSQEAEVVVFKDWASLADFPFETGKAYVLRSTKQNLFDNYKQLSAVLEKVSRLNVVITDIERFTESDFETYKTILSELAANVQKLYLEAHSVQFNILTDRFLLDKPNHCGAGDTNITLAPNGKFYVCPAFYYEDENGSVGDMQTGLDIRNPQLYKLPFAPICRKCDAYHCKRCVWLNRKTTLEVNTPSHEQCVVAHLERNASRDLLMEIQKVATFMPEKTIAELDYLDPFDVANNWK